MVCVVEFYFVLGLDVLLAVTSGVYGYGIEFSDTYAEYFWDELYLFLWRLVKSYRLRQSIQMIIRKRFLTKRRRSIQNITFPFNHRIYHSIIRSRLNNINIPSNKFQLRILIFLTTIVINSNPTRNIWLSFLLIYSNDVVCFPLKTSCSVC